MEQKKYKKKKKKLGSYPFASVVFSITLALFVVGLFGLLVILTNSLTNTIKENIEMQIFLQKNLSKNEIVKISKTLTSKDYIGIKDGDPQVRHISKEEAAKQFTEETGEDFVKFLGDNPLRDVIVIKVNPEFHAAANLQAIKKELEFIRGVYEVSYVENLISSINENLTKVSLVLVGFSVILFAVVVILINNTIKLALFSQRFLIRSMQLVGATAGFIQKPFLIRAALYGMVSGTFALVLLWGILLFANDRIDGLADLQSSQEMAILAGGMVFLGIFVGFLSTFSAMSRYLKLSLDELY